MPASGLDHPPYSNCQEMKGDASQLGRPTHILTVKKGALLCISMNARSR